MSGTTRVPEAEITGAFGTVVKMASRRMFGRVPRSMGVMWNHPAVLKDMMRANRRAERWHELDEELAGLARMAAAAEVGCGFCLDLDYFLADHGGLDAAKAREVPRWRTSSAFTPLERRVMDYAAAMSQTPTTVTDDLSAALLDDLGAAALVELTARVGADEHGRPDEHRPRHRGGGVLGLLRPAAPRGSWARRVHGVVTSSSAGGDDDPFTTHRGLLVTVAHQVLGSAADAEDVLQESWLRWTGADRGNVRDPRGYLVRVVTRQALNHLRAVSRRCEEYVGEWLPEPLLTAPDVADDVELADSVSIAMLTVLETLAPVERAVFVLREVFDVPYAEIAGAVDRSPEAVRQIAHRARGHVAARRPRGRVDRAEHAGVVARLTTAMATGDLQGLMDVLSPDVVAFADGGGQVRGAARRPITGAAKLAAYLLGGTAKAGGRMALTPICVNRGPGVRVEVDGELAGAVSLTVEDGRVTRVFTTANPQELAWLDRETVLTG